MANFFSLKLIIYFFLFVSLSCCVASPLTLEQRVQQLEQKKNVDMKESFENKVKSLEVKVSRLEEKVEHQELQLNNLTEQLASAKEELILSKNVESSDDHSNQRVIYGTCHEARTADSTLKSGMQWIDPDGKAVGDDPIRVLSICCSSPMTEYNPLLEWPIHHKSVQDFGIPSAEPMTTAYPEHLNCPNVWAPEEFRCTIRPKLRRVMGKRVLSVMVPKKEIVSCAFR